VTDTHATHPGRPGVPLTPKLSALAPPQWARLRRAQRHSYPRLTRSSSTAAFGPDFGALRSTAISLTLGGTPSGAARAMHVVSAAL